MQADRVIIWGGLSQIGEHDKSEKNCFRPLILSCLLLHASLHRVERKIRVIYEEKGGSWEGLQGQGREDHIQGTLLESGGV